MMRSFRTTTYGKWILAGEHAVLRGCPALAFPLRARRLELEYEPGGSSLEVIFEGAQGAELKLLFYGVLENALSRWGVREPLHGRFRLVNTLPVGAGMGASAALCGAVARWGQAQGWIGEGEVYESACRLEDLFHGESSGVDVAVSLSAQGVRFVRHGERAPVRPLWWPRFYLSYSGQRGMTSDCVNKVKRLFETDRRLAEELDIQMRQAVEEAEAALLQPEETGLPRLLEAVRRGGDCFSRWGLCHGDLGEHLQQLEAMGAGATKPTGSGGGGYALSLWTHEPPDSRKFELLPIAQPVL